MKTPFEPLHKFMLDQAGDAGGGGAPAIGADAVAGTDTTTAGDKGGDQAPSLRESLEANMEIAEKGEDSPDLSTAARTLAGARKAKAGDGKAPPAKQAAQAAPNALEAEGKAKRAAELAAMAPDARAKAEAEDKAKAEAPATEAPAHWPAADREMFAKQPPEVKQFLLKRHSAMEADYTKKTQEIGTWRREKDEIDEAFKAHRQSMDLNGVSVAGAVKQLVAQYEMAQKDPAGFIRWFADQHRTDLKALVEGAAAADPAGESPTVKALRQQVEQLTGKLTEFTGAQAQQQKHAITSQIEQFAMEKDAQGNLKHPYFEGVRAHMAALYRDGLAQSFQDAYDQAVHANPQFRTKVLAAQDAERRAKEEADRKAKADSARKASFNVNGEGAAAPMAPGNSSLRDSLEKAWDAGEGRV